MILRVGNVAYVVDDHACVADDVLILAQVDGLFDHTKLKHFPFYIHAREPTYANGFDLRLACGLLRFHP